MIKKLICYTFCLLTIAACAIENDIPYPIVEGSIQDITVEGQCAAEGSSSSQATIDKNSYTVKLYVDDTVDLSKLRITRLTVSNDAALVIDSTRCNNYAKFPTTGFNSLNDIPISSDTRVDFSSPVTLTLRTYQDYEWKITVEQIVKRSIVMENQIGNAVIDPINRNVIVYVSKEQRLDQIKVTTFNLGGEHGTVYPDPTAEEYYNFSQPCTFFVSQGWEETSYQWTVYVYHTDESTSDETEIFSRATSATLTGSIQSGKQPVIEYKKTTDTEWTTQPAADINISGTSYTTLLQQLTPGTDYEYRVSVDGIAGNSQQFSTAPATPLTDGSFDYWNQDGKLWNPWPAGGTSFWDTGNKGAVTISDSNSIPTDETCNGNGQAASLESKYLVLKFAAGNIFTGSYVKTVGTNGVLSFGRPFTSFPSKLHINYKYTSATIDKVGEDALSYLKGRPDSCHIYIALTDWDEPREIRTRPSERQLFDKTDSKIIAYAELVQGSSTSTYQQKDLVLDYRYTNRTPKYIVVVATASKYGDYFTGGVGSKLWLDNFELIYE
ncbi:PCMD domain-containing protein [Mediterranea massiliensis]|uniref:PCMD domain-containing protein n=1 Tax=Mediterranea massiliensis TaxID=1841865 RepID=UPI0025A31939|nr:PCMD domain-containing protein [Mediterranea massiliensis]MDM8337182.1 PCMD domain-containing protein [Mediterranea massiliensis]